MTDTSQGSVGLVVKLPFASPEEFLARYGRNVTRGGIYLRAKVVKAPGTAVALDLRLANGERLIYASATVEFVTGQAGEGVSGMGLRFVTVDPATQRFLDSAVAALPHARSSAPPLPPNVGPAAYSPASQSGSAAPEPSVVVSPELTARAPGAAPPASAAASPAAADPPGSTPTPSASAEPPSPSETESAPPSRTPASPGPPAPAAPTLGPTPTLAVAPTLAPVAPPPTPSGGGPAKNAAVAVTSSQVPSAPPFEEPKDEPKRTGPIIGIDLGTTNSCAAFMDKNKPGILPSREGHNTVPSIIALNARGKLVIGHPAKGQMLTNPRQTVYGAKRLVGRAFDTPIVQQIMDRFPYQIAPAPNGDAAVQLGDRVYTLQQISAMVLREVKELAQNKLGQPVSRAVITVPAYYSDNQRQAVRESGRLAGLHVERILNEPTAAALAYGYGRKLKQRILVYDLGGGTFDASVLELHDNVYEVISTGGDTFLGGIDFDSAIVTYLLDEFRAKSGSAFQGDRVALQRVTDAAERAKCLLSERTESRVHVPFVTLIDNRPFDLDVILTRAKLVELTSDLVDRTLKVCGEVLAAKNLTKQDIDEVVLVGGQSRFPLVHEKIQSFFGKAPSKGVHPDEAVALGAALLAYSLGLQDGVVLIDVLPMAIGIALPGGRFKPVLERNTALPSTKRYSIATRRDDQRELELAVFQGDSERLADNEYLGTLRLVELPKGPRGSVQIEVAFEVSAESLLKVSARELSTGKEVSATLFTRDTPAALRSKVATLSDPNLAAVTSPVPIVAAPARGSRPGVGPGAASAQTPSPAAIAATTRSPGFFGWFKRLFVRS